MPLSSPQKFFGIQTPPKFEDFSMKSQKNFEKKKRPLPGKFFWPPNHKILPSSLLKITLHAKSLQKWNYILLTNHFKDEQEPLKFGEYLRRTDFIHGFSIFPFTSSPLRIKILNSILFIKGLLHLLVNK